MKLTSIQKSFSSPKVKVEFDKERLSKINPQIERNIHAGMNIFMDNNLVKGKNPSKFNFVIQADETDNLKISLKKSRLEKILNFLGLKKGSPNQTETITKKEAERAFSGIIASSFNKLRLKAQ